MTKMAKKIEGTADAWESGELGMSAEHVQVVSKEIDDAIDASIGLQMISIRLPKDLIDAYKLIGAFHGVGYQPLMRDILQRFAPEGMKEIYEHHKTKAEALEIQFPELRKAA